MLKNSIERENYLAEIANLAYRLANMITKENGDFTEEYQQIVAHDESEHEMALYQEQRIERKKQENEYLLKRLKKSESEGIVLKKQLQNASRELQKQDKKKQYLLIYIEKLEQEIELLTGDCDYCKKHYDSLYPIAHEDDE